VIAKTQTDRLFQAVYADLYRLAARYFRGQPTDHTLQPTALVHEAYLRLLRRAPATPGQRDHFTAIAATAMRQVLVSYARRRHACKRGGDRQRIDLDAQAIPPESLDVDLLELDDALTKLEGLDPRLSKVVELMFFAGLKLDEASRALKVSKRTAERLWCLARAWLSRELCSDC